MDTPMLDARIAQHDQLGPIFGKMTVKFSATTAAYVKEILEEVLGVREGVIVETKELPFDKQLGVGKRVTDYDNVGIALLWLLVTSRQRATVIRRAFGFQIVAYPDLDKGGLRLTRLG